MTSRLFRTAFFTSTFAYLVFAYVEYLEPGMVSDVLSVHWWLLAVFATGGGWARESKNGKVKRGSVMSMVAAGIVGLVVGSIVWEHGVMFGDFRLLLALGAGLLPCLGLSACGKDDDVT